MNKTSQVVLILTLIAMTLGGCGSKGSAASSTIFPTEPARQSTKVVVTSSPEPTGTPLSDPGDFKLTSPTVAEGGMLPAEYTCDGAAATLALAWSGAPAETKSYAVIMHHEASPTDIHWYWVLYDLPTSVTSLSKNVSGIGTLGTNSVNDRTAYTPPCSKGPGPKVYTYTVYALSAEPVLGVAPDKVNRAVLLAAIQKITLASAELNVVYSRK